MKKFTKILSLFFVAGVALMLAACGRKTEAPTQTKAPATTTQAPAVTTTQAPAVTTTQAPSVDYDAILNAAKDKVKISGVATAANRDFTVTDSLSFKYGDVTYDIALSWVSSNPDVIRLDGLNAIVTKPEDNDVTVKLTCTMTLQGHTATKEFNLDVYKREITPQEILAQGETALNTMMASLGIDNVTQNVELPNLAGLAGVSWASENIDYITPDGTVFRPEFGAGDQSVKMTATLTSGSATKTVEYTFVIKEAEKPADSEIPQLAARYLTFDSQENLTANVTLPTEGRFGTTVEWKSSNEALMTSAGVVTQPDPYDGKADKVYMTATVKLGDYTANKTFIFTVKEKDATTDAEKVFVAFNNLGNDYLVVVEHELTLNNTYGDYTFTFATTTDGLAIDGNKVTVTRKASNYPAFITATATVGGTAYTNRFGFLVKADGKGEGTAQNPYVIETVEDLQKIGSTWALDAHYVLYADLDLTGVNYTPIGTKANKFTGTFNGYGHTISNLKINDENLQYAGLFGYVSGGKLSNVRFENCEVVCKQNGGILVGQADGTDIDNILVKDSLIKGMMSGDALVACIAGQFYSFMDTPCYMTNVVAINSVAFGQSNVGLIVAQFREVFDIEHPTITAFAKNVYAQGKVYACRYAGGAFGAFTGQIENLICDVEMNPIEKYAEGVTPFNGYNANGGVFGSISSSSAFGGYQLCVIKNVVNLRDLSATFGPEIGGRQGSISSNSTAPAHIDWINVFDVYPYLANGSNLAYTDGTKGTQVKLEKVFSQSWFEALMPEFDFINEWSIVEGVSAPTLMFNTNVGLETYVVEQFIDLPEQTTSNVVLNTELGIHGLKISWASSDATIIAVDGTVTRPAYLAGDKVVTLTATFYADGMMNERTYTVKVLKAEPTEDELFGDVDNEIKEALGEAREITNDLTLITTGSHDATITWTVGNGIGAWKTDGDDFTGWTVEGQKVSGTSMSSKRVWKEVANKNDFTVVYVIELNSSSRCWVRQFGIDVEINPQGGNGNQVFLKYNEGGDWINQDWLNATGCKVYVEVTRTAGGTVNFKITGEGNATPYTHSFTAKSANDSSLEFKLDGTGSVTCTRLECKEAINANGKVTRPSYGSDDATVTLTATVAIEGHASREFTYTFTVKAWGKEAQAFEEAKNSFVIDTEDPLTADLTLPTSYTATVNGEQVPITIVWSSSNTQALANDGKITRPAYLDGNAQATLTATLTSGNDTMTITYEVVICKIDPTDADFLAEAKAILDKMDKNLTGNVAMPTFVNGVQIVGANVTAGNDYVVVGAGELVVTKPAYTAGDKDYSVTLTLKSNDLTQEYTFSGKVLKNYGTGTAEDPFVVDSVETLLATQNSDKYFIQMADIDLSTVCGQGVGNWNPIVGFKGVYDGNGFSIKNLYIDANVQYCALFKNVLSSTIKNVVIDNAYVKNTKSNSAILIAKTEQGSDVVIMNVVIKNSTLICNLGTGDSSSGALIGFVDHRTTTTGSLVIENAYVDCDVEGSASTGGFIGILRCGNNSATLTNCYYEGTVKAYKNSGIFIGSLQRDGTDLNTNVIIQNCVANGVIMNNDETKNTMTSIGGFVGQTTNNNGQPFAFINNIAGQIDYGQSQYNWSATFLGRVPNTALPRLTYEGCYVAGPTIVQGENTVNTPSAGCYSGISIPEDSISNMEFYTGIGFSSALWKLVNNKLVLKMFTELTANEKMQAAYDAMVASLGSRTVDQNVTLPTTGMFDSTFTWASDNAAMTNAGVITRPTNGENATVTLTVTVRIGESTKDYQVQYTVVALSKEESAVRTVYDELTLPQSTTTDLTLQTSIVKTIAGQEVTVTLAWTSSNTDYITNAGAVTRPGYYDGDKTATLTVVISAGTFELTKEFTVKVEKQEQTKEQKAVDQVYDELSLAAQTSTNLTLPTSLTKTIDAQEVTVTLAWVSANTDYITNAGVVTRPSATDGDKTVKLTVTISAGGYEKTKEFNVTVLKESAGGDSESVANQKAKLQTIPTELSANVNLNDYLLGDCRVEVAITSGSGYIANRYNYLVLNRAYGDTDQAVAITFTITCGGSNDTYAYTGTVKALTSAGDGTQADPIAVYDTTGYLAMTQNKYYIITKDIDFTDVTGKIIQARKSVIDGQMHIVSNYVLTYSANSGGMFQAVGTSFELRNIIFDSCTVTNTNSRCGLLIGYCESGLTLTLDNIKILNATVSGNSDMVGGVIGRIDGQGTEHYTLNNIYVDANITCAGGQCGGLIGGITRFGTNTDQFNISNIYTTGTITVAAGKASVGGIVGNCAHTKSSAGVDVDGTVLTMTNVVSNMTIVADKYVAGILGYVASDGAQILGKKSMSNAIFLGTITANEGASLANTSSIVGRDNSAEKIVSTNCYTKVEGTNSNQAGQIAGTVLTSEQLNSWEFYESLGFSSEYWTIGVNGLTLK